MSDKPTPKRTRPFVVPAVTAALLAAFGAGVYIVAGGGSFNPQGLIGSYGSGTADASAGYRIDSTEAGSGSNRHDAQDNDTEDAVKQVEESQPRAAEAAQDAFTGAGDASTTTSAYNVTGADDGTGVTVNNGGSSSDSANSSSGNGGGDSGVIVIPDSGDGSGGETDGDGTDSDGKHEGSGGKDDSGSKDDPTPTPKPTPTDNSYAILPSDPTPSKDASADSKLFPNKAGADASEIEQADEGTVSVNITQADSQELYYGQKLDAWTIFCALSTTYTYRAPGSTSSEGYRWECTQDEFDTYPYFQIASWTDEEGNLNPSVCPESGLTITVRYRFSEDGAWREQTVAYEPQASRVYILGQTRADGSATILGWSEAETLNLLTLSSSQLSFEDDTADLGVSITGRALRDAGYVRDDGTITHLLLGWEEAGEELGLTYAVTPGRHVIQPSGFSELDEGYSVRLQNYQVRYSNEEETYTSTLQTLVDVDESVLTDGDGTEPALAVPCGIQAVDDAREDKSRAANWSLSEVELPATALYYNTDGPFIAQQRFEVAEENAVYASTEDGILSTEDGSGYLGIPAALTELEVPSGVTSVQVQQVNELSRITVHGTNGEAPALQTDNLRDCELVVDDDIFDAFIEKNYAGLASSDGEGISIARASNPEAHYACSGGMVYSEDDLVRVRNSGSDTVFVQIPTTIKAGAFEGATDVSCVVLFNDEDCVLEPGSLAGGAVKTIVCFTDEQAASVTAQLEAAGAPDAHVILAQASAEDMLYYKDGNTVTLLSDQGFAQSFNGTVTTEDGASIEVDAIAPYAFAGDTDLTWVNLGSSVTSIGAYAFAGCSSLQGLFIGATDNVTVGTGALEGCESLGFVASASPNATFASTETPNENCVWYCPDSHTGGYDARFTYLTGIDTLLVEAQGDGSLVLYGSFSEDGEADIALGSGTYFEGTLVLPSTVTEIFTGAFASLGGSWTVDWASAPSLTWIDQNAFANSGLSGSLTLTASDDGARDLVEIGKYAFQGCNGLAAVCLEANEVEIGSYAFAECGELANVAISSADAGRLGTGAFTACGELSTLQLNGASPANLTLASPGIPFAFTDSETGDEAVGLAVPAGSEKSYLSAWIYSFVGYAAYDEYFAEIQFELTLEQGFRPTEAQVRGRMAQELLAPENHLRRMLGLPEVESSTIIVDNAQEEDGFTFTQGESGAYTLTAAPADAVNVDLDAVTPEGCTSLTIAAGAFEPCTGLERVDLGELVDTIESGAFSGCDGVTVSIAEGRAESIALTGGSADEPFTFGAGIALEVPEVECTALLAAWPMRCLGYSNTDELEDWAFTLLWNYLGTKHPHAKAVAHINGKLLEQENYLRGLMGLDPISSTDELAYQYESSW